VTAGAGTAYIAATWGPNGRVATPRPGYRPRWEASDTKTRPLYQRVGAFGSRIPGRI
jgi:hypothetical protein